MLSRQVKVEACLDACLDARARLMRPLHLHVFFFPLIFAYAKYLCSCLDTPVLDIYISFFFIFPPLIFAYGKYPCSCLDTPVLNIYICYYYFPSFSPLTFTSFLHFACTYAMACDCYVGSCFRCFRHVLHIYICCLVAQYFSY